MRNIMTDFQKQFEYIKQQLIYIKSKVALDNQLGLYDINKLGEDLFLHILNDVYDWNLENANNLQENFPAIDLIDNSKKIVIQITSTTSAKKLRDTIEKLEKINEYSSYKLKMFYINEKPNFTTTKAEFGSKNIFDEDLLGIDDILQKIKESTEICNKLYHTLKLRLDSISFKFNIVTYFDDTERHLNNLTTNKFLNYENDFKEFILSTKKVLEIFAVGGNGKSHLLKYFTSLTTEYIPLIFTKQINIEEDLSKLDSNKKYLFIFDDIDRFLDTNILISLLSFIQTRDIKLIISYRTASKRIVEEYLERYNSIESQLLEIIWIEDEIKELILKLDENKTVTQIHKLIHTFNSNPYLISQAISGNIDSIQKFSLKIIDDAKKLLKSFEMKDIEIETFLFELSLLTPISKKYLQREHLSKMNVLVDAGILRELASKYRFNPDIQGDLYLAYYIDKYKDSFEETIERYLTNFSKTIFTNLSYALIYNKNASLQSYIKNIIKKWDKNKEYNNLELINKIVYFAPLESFLYLENATKKLTSKENEHIGASSVFDGVIYKIAPSTGDFNQEENAINMGSIEPIISQLINMLKNNISCDELEIKHIIQYLISKEILEQKKPYYDNQTVESIFEKLVSPIETSNFEVIYRVLEIVESWINENPINLKKVNILSKTLEKLLSGKFESNFSDGFTYYLRHEELNINHPEIKKILDKSKLILLNMLENNNIQVQYDAIHIIQHIGGFHFEMLSDDSQKFYKEMRIDVLKKILEILPNASNLLIVSEIEELAINTLNFKEEKEEAINVLSKIPRTNEYIFYQMLKGVDFLIIDFDKFYTEYKEQTNIKDWMFDYVYRTDKMNFSEEEINVVKGLSTSYTKVSELTSFLNSLNMSDWNSSSTLLKALNIWFEINNKIFQNLYDVGFNDIENELVINVLKEFYLENGLKSILLDDIVNTLSNEELIIYIYAIFKNEHTEKIQILDKIISLLEDKKKEEIRKFISIISQKIYFYTRDNIDFLKEYKQIIIKFLDWQLLYKFDLDHYILFICELCKKNDIKFPTIKSKLENILSDNSILIRKYDLNKIYNILDFGLQKLLENLFDKLISKKEDKTFNHSFFRYFDYDKIEEVLLVKDYVKSYEDFEFLINKVLDYYNSFSECYEDKDGNKKELKIDIDYFLRYSNNKEYLEKLFKKLIETNEIEKIIVLYKIIPISIEHINLIVSVLNKLDNVVDNDLLINYLTQVGKIKSYSSSPLQNSPQLLSEEEFLKQIKEKVNNLSLQIKIKEELKYIELTKKREIESDIEYLLDK